MRGRTAQFAQKFGMQERFPPSEVDLFRPRLGKEAQSQFGLFDAQMMRRLLGVETELAGIVTPATDEVIDGLDHIVQILVAVLYDVDQVVLVILEIICGQ